MSPKTVKRANNPEQEEMCFPEAAFKVFEVVGDGDVLEVWVGVVEAPLRRARASSRGSCCRRCYSFTEEVLIKKTNMYLSQSDSQRPQMSTDSISRTREQKS
jgi:hypothetical protein